MGEKCLVFRIAATYIGTVIGAGFASGQEIIQFFTYLGLPGFWGIALAAIFFAFFGFLILYLAQRNHCRSYGELLVSICGPRLGGLMDWLVTLFLLGGLCVMIAGGGAIFAEHLGFSYTAGVLITAFLVVVIVIFGIEGVMAANSVIVPIMLMSTLLVSYLALAEKGVNLSVTVKPHFSSQWIVSSLLYVAYNMTLSVGVLASLGGDIRNKRKVYWGGIAGGLVLGILILANNLSLTAYYPGVLKYQIPMLYIASHYGIPLHFLYVLVLWLEMISTAIGNVYSLAKKAESLGLWSYGQVVWGSVFLAVPFSYWGFAHLVSWLYPFFGYLSLLFLLSLLVNFYKQGNRA